MKHHSPGFLRLAEAARSQVRETSAEELLARRARGEPFVLLDVREDHEWAAGHLPGAAHLGRGILERDVETRFPDPHTEIVVYCGGGYRSALAAQTLQTMGYDRVRSLAGGYRGWTEASRPLEGKPT